MFRIQSLKRLAVYLRLFTLLIKFSACSHEASEQGQQTNNGLNATEFVQDVEPECELGIARVVNGQRFLSIDRFPYIVSLQRWDEDFQVYTHYCGGVLISNNMVVTAAHCLYLLSSSLELTVDLRTNAYNEGPFQVKEVMVAIRPNCRHQAGLGRVGISRYYMPRQYNGRPTSTNNYDIAILVLDQALPFIDTVIDYRSSAELDLDAVQLLVMLGYGGISAGERSNGQLYASRVTPLRVGPLSYLDSEVCEETIQQKDPTYVVNEDKVLCAFNENVDACFGDSGGPLIFVDGAGQLDISQGRPENDVFVGLVSWGPDWACTSITGFPGIYTKISSYVRWIDSVIERESQDEVDANSMSVFKEASAPLQIPIVTVQPQP